jgi:hypothetical protein
LGSNRSRFERPRLIGSFRHEVLDPAVERELVGIDGAVGGVVRLAIMIARNRDDEARIILVGFIKVVTILVDIAGEVNHVAEVVIKRGLPIVRQALGVLGHHRGHEILLLSAVVARIPDGVKNQHPCPCNLLWTSAAESNCDKSNRYGAGPSGVGSGWKG